MITLENITNHDISIMPSIRCCCFNCHAARLPTQTCSLSVSLLAHICINWHMHSIFSFVSQIWEEWMVMISFWTSEKLIQIFSFSKNCLFIIFKELQFPERNHNHPFLPNLRDKREDKMHMPIDTNMCKQRHT